MKVNDTGDASFESFFNAIASQESGGDYGAVNPRTGASGKYQIMPNNIGPWSQQYLGRRISVQQFRSSPQLQDQLARAVLKSYYDKWGARGAAAAWYSGSPDKANDYSSVKGGPSIGAYVDQVLGHQGSGGASSAPMQQPSLTDPFGQMPEGVDGLTVKPDSLGAVFSTQQASSLPTTQPSLTGGSGSDTTRDGVIAEAMRYIGTPYVWGGTSPKGFDCSGFTQFVLSKFGVNLPRISADQARYGQRVDISQLRPGDLVAWDENARNNGADHIAIYAGNGQIIEAPHTGASVRVRSLGANEGAWGVSLGI